MRLKFFYIFLSVLFCALLLTPTQANNVAIQHVRLDGYDADAGVATIAFDLSWENSWRDSENMDAVYVFAKYSTDGGATWNHAYLFDYSTNWGNYAYGGDPDSLSVTASYISTAGESVPDTRSTGAFIYRDGNGSGNIINSYLTIPWWYDKNGVDPDQIASQDGLKLKLFATEMVWIPTGSFDAGDNVAPNPGFGNRDNFVYGNTWNGSEPWNNAWYIDSEYAISCGPNSGTERFYQQTLPEDEYYQLDHFTIPASVPKGYAGFFIMKYELSQGAYRDFLNTLTRQQQNNRSRANDTGEENNYAMSWATTYVAGRNTIRCPAIIPGGTIPLTFGCDGNFNGIFDEPGDGQWRAMNYLENSDICAYADWAGLRVMTELEYEKAARGPGFGVAVPHEYAWGSTAYSPAESVVNDGEKWEGVTEQGDDGLLVAGGALIGTQGPLRSGFAAFDSSSRVQAGSSYYGVMDLSGNLWEPAYSVGCQTWHNIMSNLSGIPCGDGLLTDDGGFTASGDGALPGWEYFGFRGGSWNNSYAAAEVSDRTRMNPQNRPYSVYCGARYVRGRPAGAGTLPGD